MAPGLVFTGKPLDVAEIRVSATFRSKCCPSTCCYFRILNWISVFCFFFVSQSAMDDFITRTQRCGLLYLALPVKHPLVVSHAEPWPVRVQQFQTISGTEWAVSWSNNPSFGTFIISHNAAYVYVFLADTKCRSSLPRTPKGTKLDADKWCM